MSRDLVGLILVLMSARSKATKPRLIKIPKGQIRRPAARKVKMRTRPQVKAVRVKGQVKCDICLGVIKKDLPSVLCGCGKQFHNSCAMRVGKCPVCDRELGYSRQKPHVTDSDMPVIKPMPLSKDDKLLLLEERFLLGEITERTYLSIKDQVQKAPDSAVFCNICGRRLLEGETCDCTLYHRTLQCPECGAIISDDDQFCSKCGVVFSTDFSKDLYQCPECGRVLAEDERTCKCGALLVSEGHIICPGCGKEVPATADECSFCKKSFVEDITECPACGRRVERNAVSCECGVLFSDMVGGIQCSECGQTVELDDKFCPTCGGRFGDEPKLEGKVQRKIKK